MDGIAETTFNIFSILIPLTILLFAIKHGSQAKSLRRGAKLGFSLSAPLTIGSKLLIASNPEQMKDLETLSFGLQMIMICCKLPLSVTIVVEFVAKKLNCSGNRGVFYAKSVIIGSILYLFLQQYLLRYVKVHTAVYICWTSMVWVIGIWAYTRKTFSRQKIIVNDYSVAKNEKF